MSIEQNPIEPPFQLPELEVLDRKDTPSKNNKLGGPFSTGGVPITRDNGETIRLRTINGDIPLGIVRHSVSDGTEFHWTEPTKTEQMRHLEAIEQIAHMHVPEGHITVYEVVTPRGSEFVTKSPPENKKLVCVPNFDHPRRTTVLIATGYQLPNIQKSCQYSLPSKEKLDEATGLVNLGGMSAKRFGNTKYHDEQHNIYYQFSTRKATENIPGTIALSIEDIYMMARNGDTIVDAELLSCVYQLELELCKIRDSKVEKNLSEKPIERYIKGTKLGKQKQNPWFKVIHTEQGDKVEVATNEVLMCSVEVMNDEVFIDLTVEQAAAKMNQYNFVLPGGAIEDGESPEVAARREYQEETDSDIDPDSIAFLGEIIGSDKVLATTSVVIATRKKTISTENHLVSQLKADEQYRPDVVRLELSDIEQLIRNGYISDSRIISAIALVREYLFEQKQLPTKYISDEERDDIEQHQDKIGIEEFLGRGLHGFNGGKLQGMKPIQY